MSTKALQGRFFFFSFKASTKEKDWDERDRRERERKDRDRSKQYDRHNDREKSHERDGNKGYDRDRLSRDEDRDRDEWRTNRLKYREDEPRRGSDRYDRKEHDRFESPHRKSSVGYESKPYSSSSSSISKNEPKRPKTPPYPHPSMNSTYSSLKDNLSSGYSSPYSTPPPPPPPSHISSHPVTMTQKLNSLILNENQKKEQVLHPPTNKLLKNQGSLSKQEVEMKKDLRNFRLLIDPVIKKGHTKIMRYDGLLPGVGFYFNLIA